MNCWWGNWERRELGIGNKDRIATEKEENVPDYDAGFKIVARSAGPQLGELAGIHARKWEPIGGEVQMTERLADRAFRVQEGEERFVVYMEAYTRWQNTAPWSVLAKSGLLSERERMPTLSLIFVFLPQGYQSQRGRIQLSVEGATTQLVRFREVCLWQQRPESWWEKSPGLMALYPLCRHPEPSLEALSHAAHVIREREPDGLLRANLLTTLAIFGRLVNPGSEVLEVIGRVHMKESPLYQEIMEEGKIEAQRAAVLEVLQTRFGSHAFAKIAEELRGISNSESLSRLLRQAVKCRRWTDFRRAIAEEIGAR